MTRRLKQRSWWWFWRTTTKRLVRRLILMVVCLGFHCSQTNIHPDGEEHLWLWLSCRPRACQRVFSWSVGWLMLQIPGGPQIGQNPNFWLFVTWQTPIFRLQKACVFGFTQHLVGNHPSLILSFAFFYGRLALPPCKILTAGRASFCLTDTYLDVASSNFGSTRSMRCFYQSSDKLIRLMICWSRCIYLNQGSQMSTSNGGLERHVSIPLSCA